MRRILRAVQKDKTAIPDAVQDLEINPRHPIIVRLDAMRLADEALAVTVAEQLLDNARVAAGLLNDPRTMLERLNGLLERVLKAKEPA
jgi:HSP90 family molecular chaperone